MQYFIAFILIYTVGSIEAQEFNTDSIDLLDRELFHRNETHSSKGQIEKIAFEAKNSNIKKINVSSRK